MERSQLLRRRLNEPITKKIKDHCRKFTAFMFSNIGIIFLVIIYTIAGAFIFIAIETAPAEKWQHIAVERQKTTSKLWKLTCCEQNVFDGNVYKKM